MTTESERIDLGNAWLEWKATCSLALCQPEYRQALEAIVRSRFHILMMCLPSNFYSELSEYRSSSDKMLFHEIESELYLRETIKGRPFKDYLFAVVAERPGGVAANMTGYLCKWTLRSIFEKTVREGLFPEEDSECADVNAPEDRLTSGESDRPGGISPLEPGISVLAADGVAEKLIDAHLATWDYDTKLAFFCTMKRIPLSNDAVQRLSSRKKSTFALLLEKAQAPLVRALEESGYEQNEILTLYKQFLVPRLSDWADSRPECVELLEKFAP